MEKDKENDIPFNKWNAWGHKSKNIPFESKIKNIGNGEEKLAKELNITTKLGGQNNTFDIFHANFGKISIKDMTNDDCILGTEGCKHMRKLFRRVVYPLSSWCEKYNLKCKYSKDIYDSLNTKYGKSRITILEGIDKSELCKSNFNKLNNIIEDIKKKYKVLKYESLKSEYIIDIFEFLKENTLQEKIDDCVKTEAIHMTLIIVHKEKGWFIVKDLDKISCPRITRGSPRINIKL